jgi:hypothetical protein
MLDEQISEDDREKLDAICRALKWASGHADSIEDDTADG